MPKDAETTTCTSCGRKIIWTLSPANKRLPVDARRVPVYDLEPSINGARVIKRGTHYISHFLTCPNASQHSKGNERPSRGVES